VSFAVYPRERTTAAAPLAPSAFDSCCVNAGSGAVRVVVLVVLGVVCVCVGVVCVLVVCVERVVAVVVCETGGALVTVTVFVEEPHAASRAIATSASEIETVLSVARRIAPSYSPPGSTLLGCSTLGFQTGRRAMQREPQA
jgi:hypothetical protein